jgi:UDP-glucose 4-epimerase
MESAQSRSVSKKKILVTGGCGYIGSHTVVELLQEGYDVVSADNGINASFEVLDGIEKITGIRVVNINVDLSETERSLDLIGSHGPFDGIIHFAALKRVEESVQQPLRYFRNNVGSTLTTMALIEEMKIPHLIFSSSCTVYGTPAHLPVNEYTPFAPAENPYGATKQTGEILYDQFFKHTASRSGISLRYFNPAGAHPSALIGESSLTTSTNLIPVITETAIGRRKEMVVYGDTYATRDGSCIRDYIYIMDLAKAHTMAMEYLIQSKNEKAYEVFNLGIGEGVTVLEAIHAFESTAGIKVNYRIGPKRAGDVAAIYADNTLITDRIGWKPEHGIEDIMQTAWSWEKAMQVKTP